MFTHTLNWIEQQLDQPLTLAQIAGQAGLSPYHFSRVFSARMGRSVMAHVRGRRLVRAARRLAEDTETRLVDLALDCGFESQEAFTRAFKRIFGVAPGQFRTGFAVAPIEGQYPMTAPADFSSSVVQLPQLLKLDAFTLAGPMRRFDADTKAEIPQLWSALVGSLPLPGQLPSWATYGAVWGDEREEGSFNYMAGVSVQAGSRLPSGFVELPIPAACYAVFRITLNGAALHPQVKNAMATIWSKLIPESGIRVADSPDFELYDGRFNPNQPGSVIDFHIPVED